MKPDFMLAVKSRFHDYTVENCETLVTALSTTDPAKSHYLVDESIMNHYGDILAGATNPAKTVVVEATEENKAFERLAPVFLSLLERGLKRDGVLVVVGGGVLQDIGCFIASVLSRGIRWELIPTTLLAQADSCIGSKSSINVDHYKNQIGTFWPPHRVLLAPEVLLTLPHDEIRSGLGEVIKLQLLKGQADFDELMADLATLQSDMQVDLMSKWITRSMAVKKPYIEADEYDRGIRNLLNYGHTFGHAYESATNYAIPHGIAVVLGILTATYLSARLGLVPISHYVELKSKLEPWHYPYGSSLLKADRATIFKAIKHDKKNTDEGINCILTRGPGRMEKTSIDFISCLQPAVNDFIDRELAD